MNRKAATKVEFARTCQLGDLLDFRNEIVHPKDKPEGPSIFVGLEHIERDTGVRVGAERIDLSELTGRRARFYAGDIVYGYLRPYLNKVWIAEFDGICSVDQYVFMVRPGVDRDYIARFLRSDQFLQTAPIDSTPGQLPRIRSGEIAATPIALPPLGDQRRIAGILERADSLRRKRKRGLDLFDSLSQSIFLEMFGRPGDPASAIKQRPLGELAELINGDRSSNYPSGDDIVGSGILFLNTTNITPEGLDLGVANYITAEKFASLTRGKLVPRDIVITLRGSLGQTAIFENAGDTGFINAQMMIIRPKEVEAGYLLQALQLEDMLAHFKKIGSGSAVPQLTAKQMSELKIPLPDLESQRSFERRRQTIRSVRTLAMRESRHLDSLFSSLQFRAFSGQL